MHNSQFKSGLSTIGLFILLTIVAYAFLALCNWDLHLKDWNGFSRFILGAIGVLFLFKIVDDVNL